MDGTIDKLRQAMAEFDRSEWSRAAHLRAAEKVLRLVRELLSEVDGAAAGHTLTFQSTIHGEEGPVTMTVPYIIDRDLGLWSRPEPLGPPDPAHGELPDETPDLDAVPPTVDEAIRTALRHKP